MTTTAGSLSSLLPCPFCSASDVRQDAEFPWTVHCWNCEPDERNGSWCAWSFTSKEHARLEWDDKVLEELLTEREEAADVAG